MSNRRVSIIERVKRNGKWVWGEKWEPPSVQQFVTQIELIKNPLTYKIYEQKLREYSEWTKLTYVDQIDKDHLFKYRKHVMDGGNERLTADW